MKCIKQMEVFSLLLVYFKKIKNKKKNIRN